MDLENFLKIESAAIDACKNLKPSVDFEKDKL
jgi:hypothetical protein